MGTLVCLLLWIVGIYLVIGVICFVVFFGISLSEIPQDYRCFCNIKAGSFFILDFLWFYPRFQATRCRKTIFWTVRIANLFLTPLIFGLLWAYVLIIILKDFKEKLDR